MRATDREDRHEGLLTYLLQRKDEHQQYFTVVTRADDGRAVSHDAVGAARSAL